MISIFYCDCTFTPDQLYSYYSTNKNSFTRSCIERYESYQHRLSARNFLIGRMLLHFGLISSNARSSISDILYSSYNKPYFERGPFFNISHSGNVVMCVMSDCYDLGIDVEEIIYLDIEQFRDCFSVKELKVIFKAENSLNEFYKLWTKKEAIIKADGRGFGIDLRELNVLLPRVSICSAVYEVSPIEIGPNYVAHLATRLNEPNFGYEAVDLQDIPLQSLLDCKMVI